MKSPVMRFVGLAVWLLTSLAAIAVGLLAFKYNVFDMGFMQKVAVPAYYVLLIAGVLSLLMFFAALAGSSWGCCGGPHDHKM